MIGNIQLLRALAALSVVYYHTGFLFPRDHPADFLGVALFFVISGFIMTYISRGDTTLFLTKRFIRIVPLYWIVTILTLIWFNFGFSNPPYMWPLWADWLLHDRGQLKNWFIAQYATIASPELAWSLITSILFVPTGKPPLLGVGWTLNLEVFFYAVFGLALAINKRWAPLIASCVVLVVMAVSDMAACGAVCDTYGHGYFWFFVFGIAVYYLWQRLDKWAAEHRRIAIILGVATLIAWPILTTVIVRSPHIHYAVPPSVLLAALLLHSAGARANDRITMALGASSYALYLVHTLVIETMRASAPSIAWLAPSSVPGVFIALATSVMLALAIYYWVEVPLLRALRRLLPAEPRSAPAATAPGGATVPAK